MGFYADSDAGIEKILIQRRVYRKMYGIRL